MQKFTTKSTNNWHLSVSKAVIRSEMVVFTWRLLSLVPLPWMCKHQHCHSADRATSCSDNSAINKTAVIRVANQKVQLFSLLSVKHSHIPLDSTCGLLNGLVNPDPGILGHDCSETHLCVYHGLI